MLRADLRLKGGLTNQGDCLDREESEMSGDFDAVILGSGLGGLTCGAHLARSGMRVLVLEKHDKIGGYAHAFKRGSYRFDCGIHSVPMGPRGFVRQCLSELGINCSSGKFIELPNMYQVRIPGLTLDVPARRQDFAHVLGERFPAEISGISRLLEKSSFLYEQIAEADFSEDLFLDRAHDFVSEHVRYPYQHYVDKTFADPQLRQILYGLWPFTGVSPDQAATVRSLMTIVMHLEEGSHFYNSGFSLLAEDLAAVIRSHGGQIQTGSEVTGITLEGDHVHSVTTAEGGEFAGRVFVSNVSPYLLHQQFLPLEARSKLWLRRLGALQPSVSAVAVYLGLKPGTSSLLPPCVTLWFDSLKHDATYLNAIGKNTLSRIEHLVLLHTPEGDTNPTLLLLAFAKQSQSASWRQDKRRIANQMLETVYGLIPGLREAVVVTETASPDTFERYTGNTGGALYGFENLSGRYAEAKMPTLSHIDNLYQVGHWGRAGSGVWNVMADGRSASHTILGRFA